MFTDSDITVGALWGGNLHGPLPLFVHTLTLRSDTFWKMTVKGETKRFPFPVRDFFRS